MKRRGLLILGGAAASALDLGAAAQPAMPRVGFLIAGDAEPSWSLFRKSMADLGYVEGRNIQYDFRAERGRLAESAAALVEAKVQAIVAVLTPAILAARRATSTIPIVFYGSSPDAGLIRNIARPEGNVTGMFVSISLVIGKVLQLIREIKPTAKSLGVILNTPDPFHAVFKRDAETAGAGQKIEIVPLPVNGRAELASAFEDAARRSVDAVVIQGTLPFAEIAELAAKHRLISVSTRREFAEAGGLMSYGTDPTEPHRLTAAYVDRLLKGAAVADLPVQLPTRFHLVLNQKTAKTLGLSPSPMFLARVDEVIE